jgi:hypothetical protein
MSIPNLLWLAITIGDFFMAKEEWRDMPGFEGLYQVGNQGRMRNHPNSRGKGRTPGAMVQPRKSGWKGQYLVYRLWKGNKEKAIYAHRAVLIAFVGEPPGKNYQANHKDGNKHNNHVSNLEWVTPLENQKHRYDVLGKHQYGELNGSNKYSEAQIKRVLALYDSGKYTQRQIAEMVGIDYRYIHSIVHGRAWKYLR